MDVAYLWPNLKLGLTLILDLLLVMTILNGILVFQIARQNRSVKVILRMLEIRQEVARANRRSA